MQRRILVLDLGILRLDFPPFGSSFLQILSESFCASLISNDTRQVHKLCRSLLHERRSAACACMRFHLIFYLPFSISLAPALRTIPFCLVFTFRPSRAGIFIESSFFVVSKLLGVDDRGDSGREMFSNFLFLSSDVRRRAQVHVDAEHLSKVWHYPPQGPCIYTWQWFWASIKPRPKCSWQIGSLKMILFEDLKKLLYGREAHYPWVRNTDEGNKKYTELNTLQKCAGHQFWTPRRRPRWIRRNITLTPSPPPSPSPGISSCATWISLWLTAMDYQSRKITQEYSPSRAATEIC